jgi:hypothetical protein
MLAWFKKIPGQLKFKYDHSDWKWTDLDSIISTVTMCFNSNTNLYSLDPIDVVSLNEFVAKKNSLVITWIFYIVLGLADLMIYPNICDPFGDHCCPGFYSPPIREVKRRYYMEKLPHIMVEM